MYLCMENRQNNKKFEGAARAGVIYTILTIDFEEMISQIRDFGLLVSH